MQKEAEINRLKDKEIISNTRRKFLITLLILLVILFFSILARVQSKRKVEKEISRLKIKESELKKQEMEAGLHANERQLAGFTLHMMQKKLILKDLLEYVKQAEKSKKNRHIF